MLGDELEGALGLRALRNVDIFRLGRSASQCWRTARAFAGAERNGSLAGHQGHHGSSIIKQIIRHVTNGFSRSAQFRYIFGVNIFMPVDKCRHPASVIVRSLPKVSVTLSRSGHVHVAGSKISHAD